MAKSDMVGVRFNSQERVMLDELTKEKRQSMSQVIRAAVATAHAVSNVVRKK